MSRRSNSTEEPPTNGTDARKFDSIDSIDDGLYLLLDAVDSESIVDQVEIGIHSAAHVFVNHVKVAVHKGLDPSNYLLKLGDSNETDDQLRPAVQSRLGCATEILR